MIIHTADSVQMALHEVFACVSSGKSVMVVRLPFRSVAAALAASLVLSGCLSTAWEANPPAAGPEGTGIQTGDISRAPAYNGDGAVPPFATSGVPAAYEFRRGYRIGAGDKLAIRVMGQPDLTGVYTVDPDGNISMPLINSIPVAGLSLRELENVITRRLRDGFLRNPSVSVQPLELRPFYILGEVRQAGRYAYQPGMTVAQAVAMASGFTERADTGEALLTRRTAEGTKTYRVPMTTQLYPGDIIYVKERWF
jgi:polysaccharide export outer membrane protein